MIIQKTKKIIIYSFIFSVLLIHPVSAIKLGIGSQCTSNSDCESNDCETSTKIDGKGDKMSFCDCGELDIPIVDDDSQDCADAYGGTEDDWTCKDGANATWDLDYCLNNNNPKNSKFPVEPLKDTSFKETLVDQILDPTITLATKEFKAIPTDLSIQIPGLNFDTAVEETTEMGTVIYFPQLGNYIQAIYKYSVVVAAIIAIVMIIVSGIQWIVSGGSPEKIKSAQKRISGAILGLIIAISSYLILSVINPNLTNLKVLSVKKIEANPLDYIGDKDAAGGLLSGGIAGTCPGSKESVLKYCGISTNKNPHPNKESLVQKIKDYSACGDLNYNILLGMCEHESGFRPGIVNCACFKGLFQFKYDTMTGSIAGLPGGKDTSYYLGQLGLSTTPLVKNDLRIFNDDLQILAVTGATLTAKKYIISKCDGDISKLSDGDIATLLYLKHNSGSGTLSDTLKFGGCNGKNNIEKGVTKSWKERIIARCKKNAFDKGKTVCTPGDGGYGGPYNSIEEATIGGEKFGAGKAASVRKAGEARVINKYHAKNLFNAVSGAGTCPITLKK